MIWKMRKVFAGNNYPKINKNEARELYNKLVKPDVDTLIKSTTTGKNIRNNILNVLHNIESSSVYRVYLHYSDKPSESEESIAENKIKKTKSWWNC